MKTSSCPGINKSISKKQFDGRCKFINTFEELLIEENNTLIFKFFLHVSQKMKSLKGLWKERTILKNGGNITQRILR